MNTGTKLKTALVGISVISALALSSGGAANAATPAITHVSCSSSADVELYSAGHPDTCYSGTGTGSSDSYNTYELWTGNYTVTLYYSIGTTPYKATYTKHDYGYVLSPEVDVTAITLS